MYKMLFYNPIAIIIYIADLDQSHTSVYIIDIKARLYIPGRDTLPVR